MGAAADPPLLRDNRGTRLYESEPFDFAGLRRSNTGSIPVGDATIACDFLGDLHVQRHRRPRKRPVTYCGLVRFVLWMVSPKTD